ncbi:hypothetical protein [Oenococcus kitaharae]|uniref:hypothetical protein n=1 Tax=Oenococcus TaxID=46254 RepID=UPI0021E73D74|nr:hypothetical protein [Oenococcus kitaharae]MCV3296991.1 hypothetical protein [Oenococcus kitaharae]
MKSAITKIYDNSDQAIKEYSLENAHGVRISVNGLTASLDGYAFSQSIDRSISLDQSIFHTRQYAHDQHAEVTVHENSLTFTLSPLKQKSGDPEKQISYSLFEDDSLSAKFSNGQSTEQNLNLEHGLWPQLQLWADNYQPITLSELSLGKIRTDFSNSGMRPWPDRTQFFDWQSFLDQTDNMPALLFALAARDEREQAALVFQNQTETQRLEIYSNAQQLMFQKKSFASHSFLTLNFFLAFSQKQSALPSNRDLWINYRIYT